MTKGRGLKDRFKKMTATEGGADTMKHLGQTFQFGWEDAATELADSPIGLEYQRLGVHKEQVPAYAKAVQDWISAGKPEAGRPKIDDFRKPAIADWQKRPKGPGES